MLQGYPMDLPGGVMDWNNEAYQLLKKELGRRKVTYARLQKQLAAIGVEETERSIASKISRGAFSFAFFVQCMRAIGVEQVDVSEVEPLPPLPKKSGNPT
jgi:hypothetical protein